MRLYKGLDSGLLVLPLRVTVLRPVLLASRFRQVYNILFNTEMRQFRVVIRLLDNLRSACVLHYACLCFRLSKQEIREGKQFYRAEGFKF